MEDKKSYYAIIPANIRYDKNITSNAKLLYGEITALCNDKGYCWASNSYFAELYGASKSSVSRWIKSLVDNGYIISQTKYKKNSKEIEKRLIRINGCPIIKNEHTYCQNCDDPIIKNAKENNTINNTINNIRGKRFTPPSIEEVKAYCKERNNNIDAEQFVDFYQSKGWMVGKDKMKDWKASIRTWEKRMDKPKQDHFEKGYDLDEFEKMAMDSLHRGD